MEHTGSMLPIIAGSESNRALDNEVDQTAADCFDDIDSDECPLYANDQSPAYSKIDIFGRNHGVQTIASFAAEIGIIIPCYYILSSINERMIC